MKILLAIATIFSLGFGFSNSTSSIRTDLKLNDTTIITDNGFVKFITPYRYGLKHGTEYRIYNNGDTMEVISYRMGKYDGKAIAFYESNRVATIRYFKDNYKTGEWLHYDTLGRLKAKTTFDRPYLNDEARWSGKEVFYEAGKSIFTQVWTNGRRSAVLIHDALLYENFKKTDKPLGAKIFMEECASCHAIKRELVGPALANSFSTRSKDWLIKFSRNGDAVYKAGDKVAKQLYEKYNMLRHPDFTYLTKGDIEEVIKYVRGKN